MIKQVDNWRDQHSKATFALIEKAIDERLAKLRGQMLQDTAQASTAKEVSPTREASVKQRAASHPDLACPESEPQARTSPKKPRADHPWRRYPACRTVRPRAAAEL